MPLTNNGPLTAETNAFKNRESQTTETAFSLLQRISANDFMQLSLATKWDLLNKTSLDKVKAAGPEVLGKYIVMRIMIEAQEAANKSVFNLTHQFRKTMGGTMEAKIGKPLGQIGSTIHGLTLKHREEIGLYLWNVEYLAIHTDKNFSTLLCYQYDDGPRLLPDGTGTKTGEVQKIYNAEQLTNPRILREIFAQIKDRSHYKHSVGYDFYQVAYFFAVASYGAGFLLYPVVLPVAFFLYLVEALIVDPIKYVWEASSDIRGADDPVEQFILQVAPSPSVGRSSFGVFSNVGEEESPLLTDGYVNGLS